MINNLDAKDHDGPIRILTESFSVRILRGMLHIRFASGKETYFFVLPLQLGRMLARALNEQINEIEKKTGTKIKDGRLSTDPVPSPLSKDDLMPDDSKGDKK